MSSIHRQSPVKHQAENIKISNFYNSSHDLNSELKFRYSGHGLNNKLKVRYSGHRLRD